MEIAKQKEYAIGATKTIGEYVITDKIAEYLKTPTNNILIEIDNTNRLLSKLQKGELDFALIEGFFDRNEFGSEIYKVNLLLVYVATPITLLTRLFHLKVLFPKLCLLEKKVQELGQFLSKFWQNKITLQVTL